MAGIDCLLNFVAFFSLFLGELQIESLLLLLFFDLGHEGPPREFNGHGALVHDLKVLMAEQCDRGWVRVDVLLRQIDIVVVGLSKDRDLSLEPIILKGQLFSVLASFLGNEVENHLSNLAYLQDALALVDSVVRRHCYLPFGGLLADVTDNDWLLGLVLDGDQAKVKLVGEVKHGAAATCSNWHYKLLSFCHNHEIVGVVRLGLRRKFDDIGDVHAWGNLRGHLVYLRGCALAEGGRFLGGDL